jgi:hypothetical protein
MKSHISKGFIKRFNALPDRVRQEAKKAYHQFKRNIHHPGLEFKTVQGRDGKIYYSVRIGIHYRALADMRNSELYWFWIGTHAEYDKLVA